MNLVRGTAHACGMYEIATDQVSGEPKLFEVSVERVLVVSENLRLIFKYLLEETWKEGGSKTD